MEDTTKIWVSWWPTRPQAWAEVHKLAEVVMKCRLPVRIGLEPNHSHGYDVYAAPTGHVEPGKLISLIRRRSECRAP